MFIKPSELLYKTKYMLAKNKLNNIRSRILQELGSIEPEMKDFDTAVGLKISIDISAIRKQIYEEVLGLT
jgi:hypothetical protein